MAEWPVPGGAYGLSVTAETGELVVCCTGQQEIRRYRGEDGHLLGRVCLPSDCLQPWHAVQLPASSSEQNAGLLAVCHGGRLEYTK